MKLIKNLFLNFILLFAIIFGISDINALSYTSYESGDEIKVNVNDTDQLSFYVVENSDSDSDTVTAITYDFVDDNKYTFDETENLIDTKKELWNNVNSVVLPSAKKLLNAEVKLDDEYSSETFTEPTWVSPKTNEFAEYWLSELAYDGAHAVIWGMDTYYNSQFHLSSSKDTNKINVKLLIEVSKEYVEGGVERTLWDDFVLKFKNTELIKLYEDSETEIEITSTDNSLSVILKSEEEIASTTNFTYENGVIKYESSTKDEELIFLDSIWVMNSLYALADLKGYNIDKLSKWLEKNNDKVLTLENDGIEFVSEDYKYEKEENGVSTTIDATILTSFELDIRNGLKSYDESLIFDYEFIFGENQKYKVGETKELKFEIDAEYSLFENIYVNDKKLESSNYTVSEGSTIVVLKKEYLDTLNNGVHILKVTFKDGGYTQTEFTIEKTITNPSTGIGTKFGILILALICVATYLLIRKQSKFPKHN